MIKPTERGEFILRAFREEALIRGVRGAQVRTALSLEVSREYVRQIVDKYQYRLIDLKKDIEYKACVVCRDDAPKEMIQHGVCRDCQEQRLRRCSCGSVFRLSDPHAHYKGYCPLCTVEKLRTRAKKIRVWQRVHTKNLLEANRRWRKKIKKDPVRWATYIATVRWANYIAKQEQIKHECS